jgi:hypothetical protein
MIYEGKKLKLYQLLEYYFLIQTNTGFKLRSLSREKSTAVTKLTQGTAVNQQSSIYYTNVRVGLHLSISFSSLQQFNMLLIFKLFSFDQFNCFRKS